MATEQKPEIIGLQIDPDGGHELLEVIYRDEKGEPWLCINSSGVYVDRNNKPWNARSLAALAETGAIGETYHPPIRDANSYPTQASEK